MSIRLPADWATNENYAAGPDVGTPTRVDPATPTDGFARGVVAAPQYFNYHFDPLNTIARKALSHAMLKLRVVATDEDPLTDTAESLGVVDGITAGHPCLVIKSGANDVGLIGDMSRRTVAGTVASITSLVCGAARFSDRIVAIGTGGNRCCFSLDEGFSWSAGANLGATPQCIVYNQNKVRFMATFAAGVNVSQDVDAATSWSAVSSGLTSAQGGIAVLSNGDTFVCGLDAAPQIKVSKSSNGGSSWAVQAGSPDPSFDRETSGGPGWICGNEGALIYHVYSRLGGTRLRVSSSTNGVTWVTVADLDPPGYDAPIAGDSSNTGVGQQFDFQPRIHMCQTTGLLVVVCKGTDAFGTAIITYASADLGATWSRGYVNAVSAGSGPEWGVAGGRLFCTINGQLFASDGIL